MIFGVIDAEQTEDAVIEIIIDLLELGWQGVGDASFSVHGLIVPP